MLYNTNNSILLFYDRITSSEIDWILRWRMFSQARQSNSKEITTYTHFLSIKQMRTRGCQRPLQGYVVNGKELRTQMIKIVECRHSHTLKYLYIFNFINVLFSRSCENKGHNSNNFKFKLKIVITGHLKL